VYDLYLYVSVYGNTDSIVVVIIIIISSSSSSSSSSGSSSICSVAYEDRLCNLLVPNLFSIQ
jgi:hypothetical protein